MWKSARIQTTHDLGPAFEKSSDSFGPKSQPSTTLEDAQLAVFHGHWQTAIALSNQLLAQNLDPILELTTLQFRSTSYFELAQFDLALADLAQIDSIRKLSPHSISKVFAEILRSRIEARTDANTARGDLNKIWNRLGQRGRLNRINLVMLVRAEIDLAELNGSDKTVWLGALSKIESESQELLVFVDQQITVALNPFKVCYLPSHQQLFTSAQILDEGPIQKEKFFARIWGTQKYAPALHDTLIRRLIYRMRKEMGATVLTKKKTLFIQETIIIKS